MGLADPKDAILLELIETISGIRYNQLSRLTGFAHGVLSYHLKSLTKRRAIRVIREPGVTSFYPGRISRREMSILKCLRRPHLRDIIEFVLEHENCTSREIMKYRNKAPSTVSSHLRVLE